MHICPCLWAFGISTKIWIQTYFELVTVVSVEGFHLFAFGAAEPDLPAF